MSPITPEELDALLPQTQCGLCGYGGCMPYAEAMIFENAAINLCPPGGIKTLQALGNILQQDPTPFVEDMQQKEKKASIARIREAECIGCTKCIDACPVDAIVGSTKQLHVILTADCTGCELCIPPCPVDCIDMLITTTSEDTDAKRNINRLRYQKKRARLDKLQKEKEKKLAKISLDKKKNYIEEAILRAKAKKIAT